ncbi:MAG TPA: hypothetical protein VE987_17545 [Polyangiaceae bacterium]|nr:hypothetical protein [Polyangiaceae bacterium]
MPEETIGAACAVVGLRCAPQYACGIDTAILTCVCTAGSFACTDFAGNEVSTTPPPCPAAPSRAGACPSTERTASLAPCSEQGLVCSYPSACPSRVDPCQCSAGARADGGFGLRFECHPFLCGAPAGSGGPDSGGAADAAAPGDAAGDADSGVIADGAAPADAPSSEDGADAPADATALDGAATE